MAVVKAPAAPGSVSSTPHGSSQPSVSGYLLFLSGLHSTVSIDIHVDNTHTHTQIFKKDF